MNALLSKETFDSNPLTSSASLSSSSAAAEAQASKKTDLNDSVESSSDTSCAQSEIEMNLEHVRGEEKQILSENNLNYNNNNNNNASNKRDKNFTLKNILNSTHHPFTLNTKSAYTSYFYTNTNTVLNKFVMSYEEQLHKAIVKGNFELCNELILRRCDVNEQFNKKFPLCLACEHNFHEIAELLIKVSL